MLVFGAYFGSRSLEKITEIRSKKWITKSTSWLSRRGL
jgi:hypothetical protein